MLAGGLAIGAPALVGFSITEVQLHYGDGHEFGTQALGLSYSKNSFISGVGIQVGINEGSDFLVGPIGPKVSLNVPGVQGLTIAMRF